MLAACSPVDDLILGPSGIRILGYHAGAQDVVQDVFAELWSHPGRYDPSAGSLRGYLTMQARHRAVLAPQLLESS